MNATRPRFGPVRAALLTAVLAFVALGATAFAEEVEEPPVKEKSAFGPIQKRLYRMDHELSFGWSYLPLDAYYKGYGLALSYTIHFDHVWAIELVRLGWTWNVDSNLKTKLIDQMPDISPAEFPAVVLFENTNVLFKMLYGKQTFLNRMVLHFELFASGGVSLVFRNPFNIHELDMENSRYELGLNLGIGCRFWIDPDWSLRVDLRDTLLLLSFNRGFDDQLPKNAAEIGISISYNL
ncbi:MAG: hypothetical protein JXR96_28625 [Deltaproteobacteria bacterium]|nr:hypothetical protein [Deltaproteobacteria bacterium]